jgi:hypothetical protein
MRLSIAQVLTVIRQSQKKALREAYADKVRAATLRATLRSLCSLHARALAEVPAAGPASQEDARHPPPPYQDAGVAAD